jgi:serine/threonine protein kinase
MAPELLWSDAPADSRSDVWSVGVILYELLTNTLPFPGESICTVSKAILDCDPRALTEYRSELSLELVGIVGRCLRRNPNMRFQSADLLARALREVRRRPPRDLCRLETRARRSTTQLRQSRSFGTTVWQSAPGKAHRSR